VWDPSLHEEERKEAEFELWSALCHQDDVYPASFAAASHIVELQLSSPRQPRFSMLQLVVYIEVCRTRDRGPVVPPELEADYRTALRKLSAVVHAIAGSELNEGDSRVACSALAMSHGQPRLAEAILDLEPDILARFADWVRDR
jgi:hypothetical protein